MCVYIGKRILLQKIYEERKVIYRIFIYFSFKI